MATLPPAAGRARPACRCRCCAVDGKTVRGALSATTTAPHLVSVYRHDTKTIAAQRQVPDKSNEISVFAKALDVLPDLTGHLLVADALHTQRAHATYLHGRGGFYLFPVALNQPTLFAAVNALPWDTTPVGHVQEDRGHGRRERRTTQVLPAPAGLPFPHPAQVILTERITTGRTDGKTHAIAAPCPGRHLSGGFVPCSRRQRPTGHGLSR